MKRNVLLVAATLAVFVLMFAAFQDADAMGPNGPAGKSKVARLYFHEQDPDTGGVVLDGAWAKMQFKIADPRFRFVFNGHQLLPRTDYTLIYYPEPDGTGLVCIGSGTSNGGGNLHLGGKTELNSDLPIATDDNAASGAQLILVRTEDVDCDAQAVIQWNPAEYIFGDILITYDDTEV